ncbi:uncharacterized protein LOC108046718 isoform X2 [Drosophila rhopaloa]|uniref:Uncharacterized protein n=1 Tax=Drosophila rhopaloa TaxID=1041015 RepID=A0ABM5J1C0_DRORH|nr:uncharacterized protein LOC108046718 isoform X2 [Drosophila rhopaloa]
MDLVRNSILLPDELFLAFSRCLGYQQELNAAATTEDPSRGNFPRTFPSSDDDSYDPCPIINTFSMRRNPFEPPQEPLYRSTLSASSQNGTSMTEKLLPSCSKVDDYQCCNLQEGPNNSSLLKCSNDKLLPQQIIPVDPKYFQSAVAPFQQFQRNVSRSQSAPKSNATNKANKSDKLDYHSTLHTDSVTRTTLKQPIVRNPCELNVPGGNPYPGTTMDRSSRNNTSTDYDDASLVGMNYAEFQRHRKMLQKIQQQKAHQQNQSNISWMQCEEPIVFKPDLNSTRICHDDGPQQSVGKCQKQSPRHQQISDCQISNTSCKPQRTGQSMYYQTPEMQRRQMQSESPQIQGRQIQCESRFNNTSYQQPPETLRNARYCPQPKQNLSQNRCQISEEMHHDVSLNRTPLCPQSICQSQTSHTIPSCGNQRSTPCERTLEIKQTFPCRDNTVASRNQTPRDMSRTMSERSCLNQTSLNKTNCNTSLGGRSMRVPSKTPEDRLAERIQDEFHETLVKDRFCPGIIQDSLDGRENFNEYAREIAFAGPVPAKPFPVDPITMIEAIKLRIDYERREIRKEKDLIEGRERDLRHQSRDGKSRRSRPIIDEDIDLHFSNKNKSEVNEGVAAFLKAETEYHSTNLGGDSSFDAHITSFASNLFDEKIKINSYTATTTPTYR